MIYECYHITNWDLEPTFWDVQRISASSPEDAIRQMYDSIIRLRHDPKWKRSTIGKIQPIGWRSSVTIICFDENRKKTTATVEVRVNVSSEAQNQTSS